MRLLFEMDAKDYDPDGKVFSRPSARGIIIRDGKIAMVHSLKYDYYKFPGGGIEKGESPEQTLQREVAGEAGLQVIPQSIREYGLVHRVQKVRRGMYSFRTIIIFCVMQRRRSICSIWMTMKARKVSRWNLLIRPAPYIEIVMWTMAQKIRLCWSGKQRYWKC